MRLVELRGRFLKLLAEEQEKRSGRAPEVWIAAERRVLLEAVNEYRAAHNRAPVSETDIIRVENCASGHVDYSSKFALYCAEIALGDARGRRGP